MYKRRQNAIDSPYGASQILARSIDRAYLGTCKAERMDPQLRSRIGIETRNLSATKASIQEKKEYCLMCVRDGANKTEKLFFDWDYERIFSGGMATFVPAFRFTCHFGQTRFLTMTLWKRFIILVANQT
jgi:hypothetical protein